MLKFVEIVDHQVCNEAFFTVFTYLFFSEATWASLNKGILLCTQCCSVHRSLGRHISQVKSLQKSHWPGKQMNVRQFNLVKTLVFIKHFP